MWLRNRPRLPLDDRGPLRVMFVITSMPVGGAETLLVNLIRGLDRDRFSPSLCCLKELGPLGEQLAAEIPTFHDLIACKYDLRIVRRLVRLFRSQRIDAVVTVGAGDKMFWGRLAAHLAGVSVVVSAIHSTGWPDRIGRLNRLGFLTRWTDAFVGVAQEHGQYLSTVEGFPAEKVCVIPNGVNASRFNPRRSGEHVRGELAIAPGSPVVGIVAALRPEKDHELFLRVAAQVRERNPSCQFLVVGDGPLRGGLEQLSQSLGLAGAVHFLGNRDDVCDVLAAIDLFVLTSKMEANPVSILEAMATGKPVVAPRVGSIAESVQDGKTGYLAAAGDQQQMAARWTELCGNPMRAMAMGRAARQAVESHWSLERMVEGYENLISQIYRAKTEGSRANQPGQVATAEKPAATA